WEKEFAACALHQEYVRKRLEAGPQLNGDPKNAADKGILDKPLAALRQLLPELPSGRLPSPSRSVDRPQRPPLLHQFRILTLRYVELLWSDRRTLRLLVWQAPVVALFLLLGFIHKPYAEKVLVPRKLDETERKALQGVAGLIDQARTGRQLTP